MIILMKVLFVVMNDKLLNVINVASNILLIAEASRIFSTVIVIVMCHTKLPLKKHY